MKKHIVRRPHIDDRHLPLHIPAIIRQIYASRGVEHEQELALTLNHLLPLSSMKGLSVGCELLYQALLTKQRIVIVGDFDADGATSTALMMEGLTLLGFTQVNFLVPNRFDYGYGLTPEIVDIAYQQGTELIITVDNGISCIDGVAKAKSYDIKVLVTDHHLPGDVLPEADAIINPNQADCAFASKSIAGVGVAFYLMMALRKFFRDKQVFQQLQITEPNLGQLLDLVALGTVADVVALDANNRILVEQGLKRIRAGYTRPGIKALIDVAKKQQQQLTASDFGFALGPRINAAGRLDDMSYGINCLLASDISQAHVMASELDGLNRSRREIEQGMQAQAEQVMAKLSITDAALPFGIALYQADWHQGVIGIVAGRIKEKFHRPSIVFAQSDNEPQLIKGSARSIAGLHIRDLLEHIHSQHPELIVKFGGHAMAAGLTIAEHHFDRFAQIFNQTVEKLIEPEYLQGKILSDGELPLNMLTLDFAEQLQQAGPWGQQFNEPVFDDVFTLVQQRIVGEKHLKVVLGKQGQLYDGIAFNIDTSCWPATDVEQVHVAYKLDINEFRGKRSVQLMVEHMVAQ